MFSPVAVEIRKYFITMFVLRIITFQPSLVISKKSVVCDGRQTEPSWLLAPMTTCAVCGTLDTVLPAFSSRKPTLPLRHWPGVLFKGTSWQPVLEQLIVISDFTTL